MPGPSSSWTRKAAPMIFSAMALSRVLSELATIPQNIARGGAARSELISGDGHQRNHRGCGVCKKCLCVLCELRVPCRGRAGLAASEAGSRSLPEGLPVRHQFLDRIAAELL